MSTVRLWDSKMSLLVTQEGCPEPETVGTSDFADFAVRVPGSGALHDAVRNIMRNGSLLDGHTYLTVDWTENGAAASGWWGRDEDERAERAVRMRPEQRRCHHGARSTAHRRGKAMTDDDLRLVLVRVLNNGNWAEVGYTLAHQAFRRPVTFRVNRDGTPGEQTLPGLALIGENDEHAGKLSVEALARQVGKVALKIDRTPELLWLPVGAHRDPDVGMWTIECVTLVEWFRVAQRSDAEILRLAGVDPATGELIDVRPCPVCGGAGSTGVTGSPAGELPIPCTACMGTGQASGLAF